MEGIFVEIDGFDQMMQTLLWVFDVIKPVKEELDAITKSRLEAMDKQLKEMEKLSISIKDATPKVIKELSAFEYANKDEPDYEKRKAIYLEALEKFPKTAWLWGGTLTFCIS
jgi:hypothetical protein